jgi:preprotein translocase subunit YajC
MNLRELTLMLADASAAPATQPNPRGTPLLLVGYLLIFLLLMYFVTIRPQSQKAKQQAALLKSLRPGDKVVTSSGIVGTVVAVKERTVSMRSAETKLEVLKSAVTDISERGGESSASES